MKRIFSRIISATLMLMFLVAALIPLTTVKAEAKATDYISVPTSTVTVSNMHAISNMFGTVSLALKGVGAVSYAAEHSDGTVGDYFNLAFAYFTGNAGDNKRIDDLEEAMLEQFANTHAVLSDIRTTVDSISADVKSIKDALDQLADQSACQHLEDQLDDFYTDYFAGKYRNLKEAYKNLEDVRNNPDIPRDELMNYVNELYANAVLLDELDLYITGGNDIFSTPIIDVYAEFLFRVRGVDSPSHKDFYKTLRDVETFAVKILSAEAFRRYCLAYSSACYLNVINETGKSYEITGVSLPDGKSYIINSTRANSFIKSANDMLDVFHSVASTLSELYRLNSFIGYTEGTEGYYAPVKAGTLTVYNGSYYSLYSLPDQYEKVFGDEFSFKITGADGTSISNEGSFVVNETVGKQFTVSYCYRTPVPNTPGVYEKSPIYTIICTVGERKYGGGYGTFEAPYLLNTEAHFVDYLSNADMHNSGIHVRLMTDLDLTGKSVGTVSDLKGSFDGNYHTISGLNRSSALFTTNNGTIRNLTVSGLNVDRNVVPTVTVGGITDVNRGAIENCHVNNSTIKLYARNCSNPAEVHLSLGSYAGGIAGKNEGSIKHSTVTGTEISAGASTKEFYDADLVITNDASKYDVTSYTYSYAGGISGTSSGSITDCYVEASSISSLTNASYYRWYFTLLVNTSYTYNRVEAYYGAGAVTGLNTGSSENNLVYNTSDPSCSVIIRDQDGNTNPKHPDFVKKISNTSMDNGSKASLPKTDAYLNSLKVNSNPFNSSYFPTSDLNRAGLEIADNNGNPIYGYTLTGETIDEFGTYTFTATYQGKSVTFNAKGECTHQVTEYLREVTPTCKQEGHEPGIRCASGCGAILDGYSAKPSSKEFCVDKNADHLCDECGEVLSTCKDDTSDHKCDLCNAILTPCTDANDHKCDTCGEVISVCGDTDYDYLCDICGKNLCAHNDTDNDHFCNLCTRKCSDCKDDNRDHLCDVCTKRLSSCFDANDHRCDTCGATLSTCSDGNRDHRCDICSAILSTCADTVVKDHKCDVCEAILSEHTDTDRNHSCEWCGGKASDHFDLDDHLCDICGTTLTTCKNNDTDDHLCDICSKVLTQCADTDRDHNCDICKKVLSICTDADKNHNCDICGAALSEHIDMNNDHICEYCSGKASDHLDEDDHKCDICGIEISRCADKNSDHKCDICIKALSECGDTDKNHKCDICTTRLSKHADADENGECDQCFVDVENHEDEDEDGICDICEEPWEPWTMPWWGILLIVFGAIALLIGGFALIWWLTDYFS